MSSSNSFVGDIDWSWVRFFKVLIFVGFIPNVFFGLIALYFSLGRPYINVDYIFITLFLVLGLGGFFLYYL